MSDITVQAGATSVLAEITIISASTGQPLPGLSAATAGIYGAFRKRGTAGGYTTFTLVAGTLGAWASGSFVEIDSANAVGRYEVGLPNQMAGSALQGDYTDFVFAVSGGGGVTPSYLTAAIVAYNPQDAVTLGLSNVAANIIQAGTATAGAASTITLAVGASATNNIYNGAAIFIVSGTGAGQLNSISSYVGGTRVATVATAWATNPNSTSVYRIVAAGTGGSSSGPTAAAIATAVWQDTTAGDFTVSGSIGLNLKTTAAPGAAGGVFVAGSNAATTVNLTGNITGNLSGSVGSVTAAVTANITRVGTAQAGASSTITLDAGASAVNNFYQNQVVIITSGTGVGQSALITTYVGASKIATINGTWATNPDNTSTFILSGFGAISANVAGNVTVGGYAAGQSPADLVLVTAANKLSTDASGRVDLGKILGTASAGQAGSVGIDWAHVANQATAVTLSATTFSGAGGNVTVGGYAAGQDPATLLLLSPANKLSTDASGRVDIGKILGTASIGAAGAVAIDWAHVLNPLTTVALTNTTVQGGGGGGGIVTGYASGQDPATLLLVSPANKIATDGSNNVRIAQTFPTNFSSMGIDGSGNVRITQTFPTNFALLSIDGSGRIDLGKVLGAASQGAAGYMGLDWAHINAPTTTVDLSGTTISGSGGGGITLDDTLAGHTTADTVGLALNSIINPATESYATNGQPASLVQLGYMIWSVLGNIKGGGTLTLTSTKVDGTTSAMTFAEDDALAPTQRLRST